MGREMTVSENCSRAARAGWAKLTPEERSAKARRAAAGNRRTAEGLLERLSELSFSELMILSSRWSDDLRLDLGTHRRLANEARDIIARWIVDAARRRRVIRKICEDVGL